MTKFVDRKCEIQTLSSFRRASAAGLLILFGRLLVLVAIVMIFGRHPFVHPQNKKPDLDSGPAGLLTRAEICSLRRGAALRRARRSMGECRAGWGGCQWMGGRGRVVVGVNVPKAQIRRSRFAALRPIPT